MRVAPTSTIVTPLIVNWCCWPAKVKLPSPHTKPMPAATAPPLSSSEASATFESVAGAVESSPAKAGAKSAVDVAIATLAIHLRIVISLQKNGRPAHIRPGARAVPAKQILLSAPRERCNNKHLRVSVGRETRRRSSSASDLRPTGGHGRQQAGVAARIMLAELSRRQAEVRQQGVIQHAFHHRVAATRSRGAVGRSAVPGPAGGFGSDR